MSQRTNVIANISHNRLTRVTIWLYVPGFRSCERDWLETMPWCQPCLFRERWDSTRPAHDGQWVYRVDPVFRQIGRSRRHLAMDHDRYSVSDPADARFRATGVIEREELVIDLQTESESGDRSPNLWAPDQMRKIMAHFVPRYKSVRTSWCVGDNLVTFNRAIAAGATPEEAAIRTLLGHQLVLAGYSRAEIRSLEGQPARYTKVVVSFLKP